MRILWAAGVIWLKTLEPDKGNEYTDDLIYKSRGELILI
jgi:hypothetical protein